MGVDSPEDGSDNEDYIFVGTALEDEQSSLPRRFQKDMNDPSKIRTLPLWKQEAVDDQGRRRFHGAFTGGYSAGYFNTVGSKEGFTPTTFRSSRTDRTGNVVQTFEDFLDEDELQERNRVQVETKDRYDTFGFTSTEMLQKAASHGCMTDRPQIIPGSIVKELVEAVADSWGVNLLKKMGWRQGRGIGFVVSREDLSSGTRWGNVAGVATDNTPIYTMKPKKDRHGLNYDPYKGSEDFRKAASSEASYKHQRDATNQKRKRGVAFGTGVLEEFDTYGEEEDYVAEIDTRVDAYQEVASEDDDETLHDLKRTMPGKYLSHGQHRVLTIGTADHSRSSQNYLIRGFLPSRFTNKETTRHLPPHNIPQEFTGHHSFSTTAPGHNLGKGKMDVLPISHCSIASSSTKFVDPPEDKILKRAVDTLAEFVVRNGKRFEELARHRKAGDSNFSFLHGGVGSDYYAWRLASLISETRHQKLHGDFVSVTPHLPPLHNEERSKLLGEERLCQSHVASNLLTSSAQTNQVLPGQEQARAAPDAQKPNIHAALAASFANRFATSGAIQPPISEGGIQKEPGRNQTQSVELQQSKTEPPIFRRLPETWWPEPLLCKRFGVPNPNKGKERPCHGGTGSRFMNDELLLAGTKKSEEDIAIRNRQPGDLFQPGVATGMQASQLADAFLNSLVNSSNVNPEHRCLDTEDEIQDASANTEDNGLYPLPAPAKEVPITTGRDIAIDLFKAIFEDEEGIPDNDEKSSASTNNDLLNMKNKDIRSAGTPLPPQMDEVKDTASLHGSCSIDALPSDRRGSCGVNALGGALLQAQEVAVSSNVDQVLAGLSSRHQHEKQDSRRPSGSEQLQARSSDDKAEVDALTTTSHHSLHSTRHQHRDDCPHGVQMPKAAATSSEVLRILDALKNSKQKAKHKRKDKKHKGRKESDRKLKSAGKDSRKKKSKEQRKSHKKRSKTRKLKSHKKGLEESESHKTARKSKPTNREVGRSASPCASDASLSSAASSSRTSSESGYGLTKE